MPEEQEREKLAQVIRQWNNNRLDLFEISQPDERLEFHGVMRFYFGDQEGGNVATKCLRVCSSSSTREVIKMLSEKFRPNVKVPMGNHSLYEIHKSKDNPTERKLDLDEKPLAVQLNWTTDNREGRFMLKADKDCLEEKDKGGVIQTFKRTLSSKEKNKNKASHQDSGDEAERTKKPLSSSAVCEARVKKLSREKEKQQILGGLRPDASRQLPIQIEFCDKCEDAVLSAVISSTSSSTVHCRLLPAYILYAAGRFALQQQHKRGAQVRGPSHRVTRITNKMVAMMQKVIQGQQAIAGTLAFWMANASELLNFLKHDNDLSPLTRQSQLDLSHLVHSAYSCLVQCLQNALRSHLPTFLADPEQHGSLPLGIEMVLNTLVNSMSLLRRCRVNPALTIQLFSQLFHFVSAWIFNQLVNPQAGASGLRSYYWGAALRHRLVAIEAWAERQGLELAAHCHLGHIIQATLLLTMSKYSVKDAKDIQNSCFKLNSLQLRALLTGYLYANNEPHIPPELIEAVAAAAEASADKLIRSEGWDVQLEESHDLRLPFLLPEGGFSCDTMTGIPPGLLQFLEPVSQKGLCSLTVQTNSKGIWTVHFPKSTSAPCTVEQAEPEVVPVTLNKPLNSGMGISIVAAKGAGQDHLGIYIKSIVKGGAGERNGKLTAGDQLLSVDGHSLVGISQERAAAIMMKTGTVVTLKVAKFAASHHGLGPLLIEHTSEQLSGSGEGYVNPKSTAFKLHSLNPQCFEHLHGNSRRKKEQLMQRNRQLYRSNPNITECFEDRTEQIEGKNISAVSSLNLCTNTFPREYLTLPTLKSQDKDEPKSSQVHQTSTFLNLQCSSKKSSMRQAMSQESLYLDKSQNLWEQNDRRGKQTTVHDSSFPIRSSSSAHNILSDGYSPTKEPRSSRLSAAAVWRTPLSQQQTPSIQPKRIDIPLTRAVKPTNHQTIRMNQNFQVNRNVLTPPHPAHDIYACPTPANKKPPQSSLSPLQQRTTTQEDGFTPTKHVSFQDPPAQQGHRTKTHPELGSDRWRGKEAQGQIEKEKELFEMEHLEQEVQRLRVKEELTLEENDRLRRLSLEWQFQKRLQEIQKRRDDDEEEEDEDLDTMLAINQMERQTQMVKSYAANVTIDPKRMEEQSRPRLSQSDNKAKTEQSGSIHVNMAANKTQVSTPEKLTFRERQSLFSLVSSAEMKVHTNLRSGVYT